ncbi:DUF2785 domain-containing protein [Burkholderiaceae bacterium UC74_6]
MKPRSLLLAALTPLLLATARADCPPAGLSPEQLRATPPGTALQARALELLDCLSNPDPALRDGLAFEQISTWARARALEPATLQAMRERLLPALRSRDEAGFLAPFAALTLSEVARVDRIKPFLSAAERDELLQQASAYLAGATDRRGFDAKQGWRHGVAHGADLLMQLSLNPTLDAAQQRRILDAVATQILADGRHAYVFGEGQRLARPALFAALRSGIEATAWSAWLQSALAPLGPADAPLDAAGLARLHNAREFLWPLYFSIAELKGEAARTQLLPAVAQALKSLP